MAWQCLRDVRVWIWLLAGLLIWWLDLRWMPDFMHWHARTGLSPQLIIAYSANALVLPGLVLLAAAVGAARASAGSSALNGAYFSACVFVAVVSAVVVLEHAAFRLDVSAEKAQVRTGLYQRSLLRADAARIEAEPYRARGAVRHRPVLVRHDGRTVNLQDWMFATEVARLWQLPQDEESRRITGRYAAQNLLMTEPGRAAP